MAFLDSRAHTRHGRGLPGRRDGFTLIELMFCLAIIGVLSSIAIPMATKAMMRTKRSEAYLGLGGIHTAQVAYFTEMGTYGTSFEDIGFHFDGATHIGPDRIDANYYRFDMTTFPDGNIANGNFSVTATADLAPGDAIFDILLIENNVMVKN